MNPAILAAPLTAALLSTLLAAVSDGLPKVTPIIGVRSATFVSGEDTLLDIAFRHGVGFEAVSRLNPDVDPWIPEPGTRIELPTEIVLPDTPHEGLVINIPEMRLFDYTSGQTPEVFSAAIGDPEDQTPVGRWKVGQKRTDPIWNVPRSIREERPELPRQVAPGPKNPLGDRWMTLGTSSYGIHGTNVRWSIGRQATHGCVRLYNDDMRRLFDTTPQGTPVHIVYQSVKIGQRNGVVYLEVHPDFYGQQPDRETQTRVHLLVLGLRGGLDASSVDGELVMKTLAEARGVPIRIGRLAAD